MKTISPYEALRCNEYAVVTRDRPRNVYGLYSTKDVAERICNDLNKRYGDVYEACAIDFGGAA